jgi:hypothetical protein
MYSMKEPWNYMPKNILFINVHLNVNIVKVVQ